MRPILCYTFDELSESTQNNVLADLRYINNNFFYEDVDIIISEFNENRMEGFHDIEWLYNGFGCQGNGASFTAVIDLEELYEHHKEELVSVRPLFIKLLKDNVMFSIIRRSHHYYHFNTVSVDFNYNWDNLYSNPKNNTHELVLEICKSIEELKNDLCRELYRKLEEQYMYSISDEAVRDTIVNNDMEFLEDGTQV